MKFIFKGRRKVTAEGLKKELKKEIRMSMIIFFIVHSSSLILFTEQVGLSWDTYI